MMFGKRGALWPAKLSCSHLCLVTDTALYVKATLCRVCPQEPVWPIKKIVAVMELIPVQTRPASVH